MEVIVNGESVKLPPRSTVSDLIAQLRPSSGPTGVAVAVNGEVVPVSRWRDTELKPGDKVDLVQAVQGG